MMNKLLLTTHWHAADAQLVLEFLDELRDIINIAYAEVLDALCQSEQGRENNYDLYEDDLPL